MGSRRAVLQLGCIVLACLLASLQAQPLPPFCTLTEPWAVDQLCAKLGLTSSPASCPVVAVIEQLAQSYQPPKCKIDPGACAGVELPPPVDSQGLVLPQDLVDVRSYHTGLPQTLDYKKYMTTEGATYYWYYRNLLNLENWAPCPSSNSTEDDIDLPIPEGWEALAVLDLKTPTAGRSLPGASNVSLPFAVVLRPDPSSRVDHCESHKRWYGPAAKAAAQARRSNSTHKAAAAAGGSSAQPKAAAAAGSTQAKLDSTNTTKAAAAAEKVPTKPNDSNSTLATAKPAAAAAPAAAATGNSKVAAASTAAAAAAPKPRAVKEAGSVPDWTPTTPAQRYKRIKLGFKDPAPQGATGSTGNTAPQQPQAPQSKQATGPQPGGAAVPPVQNTPEPQQQQSQQPGDATAPPNRRPSAEERPADSDASDRRSSIREQPPHPQRPEEEEEPQSHNSYQHVPLTPDEGPSGAGREDRGPGDDQMAYHHPEGPYSPYQEPHQEERPPPQQQEQEQREPAYAHPEPREPYNPPYKQQPWDSDGDGPYRPGPEPKYGQHNERYGGEQYGPQDVVRQEPHTPEYGPEGHEADWHGPTEPHDHPGPYYSSAYPRPGPALEHPEDGEHLPAYPPHDPPAYKPYPNPYHPEEGHERPEEGRAGPYVPPLPRPDGPYVPPLPRPDGPYEPHLWSPDASPRGPDGNPNPRTDTSFPREGEDYMPRAGPYEPTPQLPRQEGPRPGPEYQPPYQQPQEHPAPRGEGYRPDGGQQYQPGYEQPYRGREWQRQEDPRQQQPQQQQQGPTDRPYEQPEQPSHHPERPAPEYPPSYGGYGEQRQEPHWEEQQQPRPGPIDLPHQEPWEEQQHQEGPLGQQYGPGSGGPEVPPTAGDYWYGGPDEAQHGPYDSGYGREGEQPHGDDYGCDKDVPKGRTPQLVILLRGTLSLQEWGLNLAYNQVSQPDYGPGSISAGFQYAAQVLWVSGLKEVVQREVSNGCRSITVAGHSLGAAVSQLLAIKIEAVISEAEKAGYDIKLDGAKPAPVSVVTFGSPNVGNAEWAANFNRKINARQVAFQGDVLARIPCEPSIVGCTSPTVAIPTNAPDGGVWRYTRAGGNIIYPAAAMPFTSKYNPAQSWSALVYVTGQQLCSPAFKAAATASHICSYLCMTSQYVHEEQNMCWLDATKEPPYGATQCNWAGGAPRMALPVAASGPQPLPAKSRRM